MATHKKFINNARCEHADCALNDNHGKCCALSIVPDEYRDTKCPFYKNRKDWYFDRDTCFVEPRRYLR